MVSLKNVGVRALCGRSLGTFGAPVGMRCVARAWLGGGAAVDIDAGCCGTGVGSGARLGVSSRPICLRPRWR